MTWYISCQLCGFPLNSLSKFTTRSLIYSSDRLLEHSVWEIYAIALVPILNKEDPVTVSAQF